MSAGKCSATNRAGLPCTAWALRGQQVCRFHGGRAPQALAVARRRAVGAKVAKLAGRSVPPDVDPVETLDWALREAMAMAVAAKRLMRRAERRMRQADDPAAQVQASDIREVMGDALDRLTRISKVGADVSIAEREVKLREQVADQVSVVLIQALADPRADLSHAQQQTLRVIVADAFREEAS